MREELYEESSTIKNHRSATTRYNTFSTLAWISYAIALFWFINVLLLVELDKGSLVLTLLFALLPVVIFTGAGFALNTIKRRFYVDYDYAIVSGSIRFSKVIKNRQRKFIAMFDAKDIDHMGNMGSEIFNKYLNMTDVKKVVLTSNLEPSVGCDFYYIVAVVNGERTLFVLDCTRKFLSVILQFSRKGILEEGTKWFILTMRQQLSRRKML